MFHVREHIRARIGGKRHKVPKSSLSLFLSLCLSPCTGETRESASLYRCRSLERARLRRVYPRTYIFLAYGKRIKSPIKCRRYIENSARGIYVCVCARARARVCAALRGLSLSLCGARNEGLSPHKADLYKALLKCTVNTEIIHPRRAIRDASARTRSLVFARMIFGGRSTGTRADRVYAYTRSARVKTIINTRALTIPLVVSRIAKNPCRPVVHALSFICPIGKGQRGGGREAAGKKEIPPAVSSIFLYLVETNCQLH